ncbi:MAG: thioredoxin family protein [Mollicutes bacterium PWAP]|nr:thioredoxin family protein [Mollicutes bacterium PWAP]
MKMIYKDALKYIKNNEKVLLEFYTDWCADCRMMEPVVDNAMNELKKDGFTLVKVNAEEANLYKKENPEFEVLKVPSFFKVINNKATHIGYEYLPMEHLIKKVRD